MAKSTTSPPQDSSTRRAAQRPRSAPAATTAAAGGAGRRPPDLLAFFQESRSELRKVTWPTRQEATNLTIAVLGMTLAIAVFLGLVDGALDHIVSWVISGF